MLQYITHPAKGFQDHVAIVAAIFSPLPASHSLASISDSDVAAAVSRAGFEIVPMWRSWRLPGSRRTQNSALTEAEALRGAAGE